MFEELENINLLQEYQMNEVIIGTLLFTIFYVIYKYLLDEINIYIKSQISRLDGFKNYNKYY